MKPVSWQDRQAQAAQAKEDLQLAYEFGVSVDTVRKERKNIPPPNPQPTVIIPTVRQMKVEIYK